MEKDEGNKAHSSNVELNLGLSLNGNGNSSSSSPSSPGGSEESVASNVIQSETQQPHIQGRIDREKLRDFLLSKPCVSTKGDGPHGKEIKGRLNLFKKYEDLRIVCDCHGVLLTPAEFVKHAGGSDDENTLKKILID